MRTEYETALQELNAFLSHENADRRQILDYLRTTPLPFLCCHHTELAPSEMFDYCFRFLHTLGQFNLPLAVGLCMNQYIAFSIACFPAKPESPLGYLKHQFLAMVREHRWLLAVSSFDDFIRGKEEKPHEVRCRTAENGNVICNGIKNFQSNVSEADVLLFSAQQQDGRMGLYYTFLKQTPGLALGQPVFGGAMADTDTRSVIFNEVLLTPFQQVPAETDQHTAGLHALTRTVFAAMAMAPYLGGAHRALTEAVHFLKHVQLDGKALSELDGHIVDMGRAQLKYQLCKQLIGGFANHLQDLSRMTLPVWLDHYTHEAMAIKYHVGSACEDIVSYTRKVVGTRAMQPTCIISQLSQQILFCALHPVLNAKIERDFGRGAFHS